MSERQTGLTGPTAETNFVLRMRLLREARGISQAEVAARVTRLGVQLPQQTIARIEAGKRSLRLDEAEAIARALGSSLTEMSGRVVEVTDAERQYAEAKQHRLELSEALRNAEADFERHALQTGELQQRVEALQSAYAEAEAAEHVLWVRTPEGQADDADFKEAQRQNWDAIAAEVDNKDEGDEQ
ncbi:helix-turn-helix transcriptional regulator [Streptomyces sp. NPDC056821]|uniref:helix-turn-helix transcriptional regulator n=1 Tax=unclassified Streptomyces TaxID=2593676 RepID=UPI0036A67CCF